MAHERFGCRIDSLQSFENALKIQGRKLTIAAPFERRVFCRVVIQAGVIAHAGLGTGTLNPPGAAPTGAGSRKASKRHGTIG